MKTQMFILSFIGLLMLVLCVHIMNSQTSSLPVKDVSIDFASSGDAFTFTPTPTPIPLIACLPPPTQTPTQTPMVTCTKLSVSGIKVGTAYFMCEGIGLRSLIASYYLDYYSCSDGFFEFRTNNQTIDIVYENVPDPIIITGWSLYLSLVTAGTGTSWFGPADIPSCNGCITYITPGGYDLCGSPTSFHYGPKPSNAIFDSVSVVILVDTGYCAAATALLDRTFGL